MTPSMTIRDLVRQQSSQENWDEAEDQVAQIGYDLDAEWSDDYDPTVRKVVRARLAVYNTKLEYLKGLSPIEAERKRDAITSFSLQYYTNLLAYSELTDRYEKLDLHSRFYFIEAAGYPSTEVMELFIHILENINLVSIYRLDELQYLPPHQALEGLRIVLSCVSHETEATEDLSSLSDNFVELVKNPPTFVRSNFAQSDATLMLFWKIIYGEQTVIEFIERFADATFRMTAREIIAILDNWQSLKTYPAEWIYEVHRTGIEVRE